MPGSGKLYSRVRFRLESGLPQTFFHVDHAFRKTVQHARGVLAVSTPSSIELIVPERKETYHPFLGSLESNSLGEKKKITLFTLITER